MLNYSRICMSKSESMCTIHISGSFQSNEVIRLYVKGKASTFGYVGWHDNVAVNDAALVKQMRESGGTRRFYLHNAY